MDKAKKLLGILGEKSIKEGARINLNYFTLTPGEHPIALIKEELQQLVETMDDWREDGWSKVSAPDKKASRDNSTDG